jgi:hypothetical protein
MEENILLLDPEDVEDVLFNIEKQFALRFGNMEFAEKKTFGEICDHIANKIDLQHLDDCTTQQAFYKLRHAFASTLNIDPKTIRPDALLDTLLPTNGRRHRIRSIEKQLGFRLGILRPDLRFWQPLFFLGLFSLVIIFFRWELGLAMLLLSGTGLWLTAITSKKLSVKTMKGLTRKIAGEHYLECRSKPGTFNRKEIGSIMAGLLLQDADIASNDLRPAKIWGHP